MTHSTNPTNAYTVPSVPITAVRTGATSKVDAVRMHLYPLRFCWRCRGGIWRTG